MWPSPSRQGAGRSRGPRGTPLCCCSRSHGGWMRLSRDVSSGSPDPTWHSLAPGLLAFQLVTGSGLLPRAHKVLENGQTLVHSSPPESLGPSLACPQHLGFGRGQLLPAATLAPSVSFQLIPRPAVPLEEEGVYLGALVKTCGSQTACPLLVGVRLHRGLCRLQASCFPQFSPAPPDPRAAAGPGGFSWGLGPSGQGHPLMSASRGPVRPVG